MKRYIVIVLAGDHLSRIANVSETNSFTSAQRNFTYWKRKYTQIYHEAEFAIKLADREKQMCRKYHYMAVNRGN